MAEDLGNLSMEAQLTEFSKLVKNSVTNKFLQGHEGMVNILEDVTEELKTYCSSWKIATQQAEDGAKQIAEKNEELEEMKKKMAERNEEELEERRQMAEQNKDFEETRKQIVKKNEEVDERRKQIEREEEQLSRRTLELEAKEKLVEDKKVELEKKEKLLQQRSADLEQTELTNKNEQARLQAEAEAIQSQEMQIGQAYSNLKDRTAAAQKASVRSSNELRRREDNLKVTHQSVFALNEMVGNSLATVREKYDENKKLGALIEGKYQVMKKLRSELLRRLESWSTNLRQVQTSKEELVDFEAGHREILAGMREEMKALSTVLEKQTKQARAISKEIEIADNDLGKLVTSTERQLGGISTKISTVTEVSSRLDGVSTRIGNLTKVSSGLEEVSSKVENVTKVGTGLDELSAKIGNVTKVSIGLDNVSSKMDNFNKVGTGLVDELSAKIGNVTQVSGGLDEVSAKIRDFQPTVIETLREFTDAMSKVQADRRSLFKRSVSRFEEIQAKRGLGATSPEQPLAKRRRRRRQGSVGAVEELTSLGRPEPLPENILNHVRSPRGQGRVAMVGGPRRDDSSPLGRRTTGTSGITDNPSGGHDPFSQNVINSQPSSSMDPATGTRQPTVSNPASSSPRTLLNSSQSGVSATDPPGLLEASNEVKSVWRQIEFPADWDMIASNMLLAGLNRATNKKNQPKSRPVGLLDSSSAIPNCFLCRVSKAKSTLDNDDGKICSNCKAAQIDRCVRVSFVAEDPAEYDQDEQGKRWKLTIRKD